MIVPRIQHKGNAFFALLLEEGADRRRREEDGGAYPAISPVGANSVSSARVFPVPRRAHPPFLTVNCSLLIVNWFGGGVKPHDGAVAPIFPKMTPRASFWGKSALAAKKCSEEHFLALPL